MARGTSAYGPALSMAFASDTSREIGSGDRCRRERFGTQINDASGEGLSKRPFGGRVAADLEQRKQKLSILGNFGPPGNLGNEGTLQAILYHLRRLVPDAEVTCICTNPETVAAAYNIAAVGIHDVVVKSWTLRNPLARLVRNVFIGLPCELYRWLKCLVTLSCTDVLIVPGTGLLTDAYGLINWGPYSIFKWSLGAKLTGCKLLFVSVGAGPLYSCLGRFFVKTALALADFRSYRDTSTQQYLKSIGFLRSNDRVYPDLVFSLPEAVIPKEGTKNKERAVVGLGVMEYAGKYSIERPNAAIYSRYLDTLVILVTWLFAHGYDVRLIIGDTGDKAAIQEFRCLLNSRLSIHDSGRIIDEPTDSVEQLLSQLAATDIVVATRFHNVLLALLLNKPVISISFHHKCISLMRQMGLSEYCQDIHDLQADRLIEQFCQLEKNSGSLKTMIREKVERCRRVLDDQYRLIFEDSGTSVTRETIDQVTGDDLLPRN